MESKFEIGGHIIFTGWAMLLKSVTSGRASWKHEFLPQLYTRAESVMHIVWKPPHDTLLTLSASRPFETGLMGHPSSHSYTRPVLRTAVVLQYPQATLDTTTGGTAISERSTRVGMTFERPPPEDCPHVYIS